MMRNPGGKNNRIGIATNGLGRHPPLGGRGHKKADPQVGFR